ncbi:unnamed protein product [Toxocara canis]|uniref:Uncharacterized protein n=1 Tax=Toxocara canis TaxID=6265 RepID=A0A183UZT2_TOXCA|nr:unnamed protein product [Toxocara canis]
MWFTSPLFDAKVLARGHSIYPRKNYFLEVLPMCSKNKVSSRRSRPAGMFYCLAGVLGERNSSESMPSSAQLNKIMALFPQPDLGKPPYRQMKRLPTQNYADDIFHRKRIRGKKS